jgi:hypothetical protein
MIKKWKHQITNSKLQINSINKIQDSKQNRFDHLPACHRQGIGDWDLFGNWDLEIGF